MAHFLRYPPCESSGCTDPRCCALGGKFEWPELVGKSGEIAKMTIERENPNVLGFIMPYGTLRIEDFCCNRVFIVVGSKGHVVMIPKIG
ncbi:hypothetical protein EUTSA_v10011055mg [Eutrema salsugineum]|uniref:Uncharacterized protein n=1 Tax=Eutrema salsugineum TaxID=72664 RepID=V4NI49_EUTSA|nr:inhibitor of trypsin and hageman factor [Eutrema salsugineum]ESQ45901.1 hypothetical protein EUTSA_v10011055mg [Eutrema salsugineum]